MPATKRKEATIQVAFKLPRSLVKRIRREAFERATYPARIVAERLEKSYTPPQPAA